MPSLRLDLNRDAIRHVALTSPEIREQIARRAEAMAAAAQSRTDDEIVVASGGRSRARSYVRRLGSGAQGEAKDRALGSAIDAGRD